MKTKFCVHLFIFPAFGEKGIADVDAVQEVARWIYAARDRGIVLDMSIGFDGGTLRGFKQSEKLKNLLGEYPHSTCVFYSSEIDMGAVVRTVIKYSKSVPALEKEPSMRFEEELHRYNGDISATSAIRVHEKTSADQSKQPEDKYWAYFEELVSQLQNLQKTRNVEWTKKILTRLEDVASGIEQRQRGGQKSSPIHHKSTPNTDPGGLLSAGNTSSWQVEKTDSVVEREDTDSDVDSEHGYCFTINSEYGQ